MWRGYLSKQATNAMAAIPLTPPMKTNYDATGTNPVIRHTNVLRYGDIIDDQAQAEGHASTHHESQVFSEPGQQRRGNEPQTYYEQGNQGRGQGRGRGRDQQSTRPHEQRPTPRVTIGPGWIYDPNHDAISFAIKDKCANCGLKGHYDNPCPFKGPNDTFKPTGVLDYCTAGDLTDLWISKIRMHCRYCLYNTMSLVEWDNVKRQMLIAIAQREDAIRAGAPM